ncbi:hypothetical protein NW768_004039 [Fusarium equiseti]|uniref:Uncharacterized protein n=1 Tax=Fusarium equiseti TaxID=61235 RepID=A0ABQ8RJK2_FUSEQ|nr:hypothetical protein NW768_004039 [Fusarium equiseti]
MKLTWAPIALFSLVAANPVTPVYEIPDFTHNYNFTCGETLNSSVNLTQCYMLMNWLGSASKTGWWTIGDEKNYSWNVQGCQVTIVTSEVANYTLNMNGAEFFQVGEWAYTNKCNKPQQRISFSPKNGSWVAYIMEVGFDYNGPIW